MGSRVRCAWRVRVQLEDVYGQVYKALKPGGMFASYEWVATKEYDASNPDHVRIMDEINFGNGLPVRFASCALETRRDMYEA